MSEILYKIVNGQRVAMSQEESDALRAKWAEADAAEAAKAYATARQNQYAVLELQLDMLWHELNNTGTISTSGEWFLHRQQVKNDNPKP